MGSYAEMEARAGAALARERLRARERERVQTRVAVLAAVLAVVLLGGSGFIGYSIYSSHHKYDAFESKMSTYTKGYNPARAKERRTSDAHAPRVDFSASGPVLVVNPRKKQVDSGVQSSLPKDDLRATTPDKPVNLVVWVDRLDGQVGSYSGGGKAYRSFVNLTFVEPGSGRVLGEEDMAGGDPPDVISCAGEMCSGSGDDVSSGDIANFIAKWVAATPND